MMPRKCSGIPALSLIALGVLVGATHSGAATSSSFFSIPEHIPTTFADQPRRMKHESTTYDILGGKTLFKYDATVGESTRILDTVKTVLSVRCAPNSISLLVAGTADIRWWNEDDYLNGGHAWMCDGEPFFRQIVSIDWSPADAGEEDDAMPSRPLPKDLAQQPLVRVSIRTRDVQANEVFEYLKFHVERVPHPKESEIAAMLQNGTDPRRVRELWWSSVSNFVSSAAETASNAASAAASAGAFVASGGRWGFAPVQPFRRSFLNWNYNPSTQRSRLDRINVLADLVACHKCHAYIGADLRISGEFVWTKMKEFEFIVSSDVSLALDIGISSDGYRSRSGRIALFPSSGDFRHLADVPLPIGAVTLNLKFSGRIFLESSLVTTSRVRIMGPGVWGHHRMSHGVAYDEANGWRQVRSGSMELKTRRYDVQTDAGLRYQGTLETDIQVSFSSMWDLVVTLLPEFDVTALGSWYADRTGCSGTSVHITSSGKLLASVEVQSPRLEMGRFGTVTLADAGLDFPYTFGPYTVMRQRRFSLSGAIGCVRESNSRVLADLGYRRRLSGVDEAQLCSDYGCAWHADPWLPCIASCGIGTQRRSVACRADDDDGTEVSPSLCQPGSKPATVQDCSRPCEDLSADGILSKSISLPPFESTVGLRLPENGDLVFLHLVLDELDNSLELEMSPINGDPDVFAMFGNDGKNVVPFVRQSFRGEGVEERVRATFSENGVRFGQEFIVAIKAESAQGASLYLHTFPFHELRPSFPLTVPLPARPEGTSRWVDGSVPEGQRENMPDPVVGALWSYYMRGRSPLESYSVAFQPNQSLPDSEPLPTVGDAAKGINGSSRRSFEFHADPAHYGMVFEVILEDHDVGLFVSHKSSFGWPSNIHSQWSDPADQSEPAEDCASYFHSKAVHVLGDDFQGGAYAAAVYASTEVELTMHATPVRNLVAGELQQFSMPQSGTLYFHLDTSPTDTLVLIEVKSLRGDADLFVRPSTMFPGRTSWKCGDRLSLTSASWSSAEWTHDSALDAVTITHLDPNWDNEYFIAVTGFESSEFQIVTQTYEQLSQGRSVSRALSPLQSVYFMGSMASEGNEDEEGLHFHARMRVEHQSPASASVYAGSVARYHPATAQGFASLIAEGVPAGAQTELAAQYLPQSEVARAMIIAVQSGFHDKSSMHLAEDEQADANAAASRHRRRLLHDVTSYADALAHVEERRQRRRRQTGAVEARDDLSHASEKGKTHAATAKDLGVQTELDHLIDRDESTASGNQRRRSLRHRAAPKSTAPRASKASMSPGDTTAEHARPMALRQTHVESFDGLPSHQVLRRRPVASAAKARRTTTETVPLAVRLYRFQQESADWEFVEECSLVSDTSSGTVTGPPVCSQVVGRADETEFFRLELPARTYMFASVVAVEKSEREDNVADAEYTLRSRVGGLPTGEENADSAVSSGRTFTAYSCLFEDNYLFFSVTGHNPATQPTMFNILVSGFHVAEASVCPDVVWRTGEFSECSVDCSVGERTRTVWCVDAMSGQLVDDEWCAPGTRPSTEETCDMGTCFWVPTPWSECSQPCDGGFQTRLVHCRNKDGEGDRVLDAHCGVPPDTRQECNLDVCPDVFWLTGTWGACSRRCGGGFRRREVRCVETVRSGAEVRFENEPAEVCGLSERPVSEEPCHRQPCDTSAMDLVYFDSRQLRDGTTRVDEIWTEEIKYYLVEKSSLNTRGFCIDVFPRESRAPSCSVEEEKRAAACMSVLQGCLEAWDAEQERPTGARKGVVQTPCECYRDAGECVGRRVCGRSVAVAMQQVQSECQGSSLVVSNENCTKAEACSAGDRMRDSLRVESRDEPRAIDIFVSQVRPGLDDAIVAGARDGRFGHAPVPDVHRDQSTASEEGPVFEPPMSRQHADWASWADIKTGPQRMLIWDSLHNFDADRILVGVEAPRAPVRADVRISSLTSFPVQLQGSLMANDGVSAQDIREGGLTLEVFLACDLFVDPREVAVAVMNDTSETDAVKVLGVRESVEPGSPLQSLGPRLLVSGLTASESSAGGWNRVVKPRLLSGPAEAASASVDGDAYVEFSFARSRAVLTLPPIPDYRPRGDEHISVTLLPFLLRSGQWLEVPDSRITVHADNRDCKMSEWSSWTACSKFCEQGTQTRTRMVLRSPRGDGSVCPPSRQTRTCNTCDPCSTMQCRNRGVCSRGRCLCPPGYSGADCSGPPPMSHALFWHAGGWSECNVACGGGEQYRTVQCRRITASGIVEDAEEAECVADHKTPAAQPCHTHSCDTSRAEVTMHLALTEPDIVTQSVDATEGFSVDLIGEISEALVISSDHFSVRSVERISIVTNGGATTQEGVELLLEIIGATGTSSRRHRALKQARSGGSGVTAEHAVHSLREQLGDSGSTLRRRGSLTPQISNESGFHFVVRRGQEDDIVEEGDSVVFASNTQGSEPVSESGGGSSDSGGSSESPEEPGQEGDQSNGETPSTPSNDDGDTEISGVEDDAGRDGNSGASGGLRAEYAGVVGAVVALAVIGVVAAFLMHRRRQQAPARGSVEADHSSQSGPRSEAVQRARTPSYPRLQQLPEEGATENPVRNATQSAAAAGAPRKTSRFAMQSPLHATQRAAASRVPEWSDV